MLHSRRLFLLLAFCLTVLSLSQIAAQDETPTLTPVPTETLIPTLLPPTETATDLPSETPLPTETPTEVPSFTPTPLPSETPTLFLTPTAVETAVETATETPTAETSNSPAPTLTVDGSLSPSPASTVTLTQSATASAAATSIFIFPTAQPLVQLFTDNFDTGDISHWTLGPGWGLVASEGGQALQTTTDAPLMLTEPLDEGGAEARVQFTTGSVQLTLRQGASGSYAVQLGADGQVKLLVTGQVVTSTTVAANQLGQWRTLRLEAANGYLRVGIDGIEVLTVLDAAPLPDGAVTIAGITAGTLILDNVTVETKQLPIPNRIQNTQVPLVTGTVAPQFNLRTNNLAVEDVFISPMAITNFIVTSVGELRERINDANTTCPEGQSYNISLTGVSPYVITDSVENYYGANGLPVIHCNIRIFGNGKVIQRSSSNPFRILAVAPDGKLTLDNVTISGGSASDTGGSGVFAYFGSITITNNSVITNNTLSISSGYSIIGAGIYSYYGRTQIDHSTISNNTNNSSVGDGGGIGLVNVTLASLDTVSITSNTARNSGAGIYAYRSTGLIVHTNLTTNTFNPVNSSTLGGAIYTDGSYINVGYSCIVDNSSVGFYALGSTQIANNNWWGSAGVDKTANVTVNTYKSSAPSNCTNPTLTERLTEYGITLTGSWNSPFDQNALDAVTITAQALAMQSDAMDHPQDAFKRIILPITFNRADFGEGTICKTDPLNSKINCHPNNNTTVFTLVHELGHIFTWRSGGQVAGSDSLYDLLQKAGNVKDLNPNPRERLVIFGGPVFRADINANDDWWRGTYGWGSAAVQGWKCDGNGVPNPPFNFQQNPCDVKVTKDSTEIEEAAADFFLNWVYRKTQQSGFANSIWIGTCYPNGCDDGGTLSGDARMNWMSSTMWDNGPAGAMPRIFAGHFTWNNG